MNWRLCAWLLGGLLLILCRTVIGQTYYKWTDEQGVVHFSDEVPPQVKHVEERKLVPAPAAVVEGPPPSEATPAANAPGKSEAPGEGGAAAGAPASGFTGPARVLLVSSQTPRISPSALHIFGQVKNVGGVDARQVVVTISAVDATQGTPCLQENTAVVPSQLRPGEVGHFDVNVDSPCLMGEPPVDVAPAWQ